LWTQPHYKAEVNFLVGNPQAATITNQTPVSETTGGENGQAQKVASVGLLDISIPVQFQITNVLDWAYVNAGPTNLLQDLATREVIRYLAGSDLDAVLSQSRAEAELQLQDQIQDDANRHQLGVKILFVGVQDLHPPQTVAADYERVVAADQSRIATNNFALADAIQTNALAGALAFAEVAQAGAAQQQIEQAAFARADLFTNQLAAYEAAPSVYRQRAYYQMFPAATANARKYILLVTNVHNVIVFDLEDRIRSDLENLTFTNSP
jgi:membrane protease subunit HflK